MPVMSRRTLRSGGRDRDCYIHFPPNYGGTTRLPLILVFHGEMGTAKGMARISRFNEPADSNGVIVVYPVGIKHWQDGRDLAGRGAVNDVVFVSDL